MSNPGPERHYLQLLLTARGIRAFGDGFVSILVPVYLTGLGIGAFEVGVLTTAMLLGPAMMTLTIGLIAHRLRRVTLLTGASMLMVLSGIGYAFETEFWPLLVIAAVGTLNPTASDVSVFAPLEQTLLSNAVLPERRTSIFASYSLIGSLLGANGPLVWVNFELSYNARHWAEARYALEIRPILGWRFGPVDLISNPIMDLPFRGGSRSLTFAPAGRVAYNLSDTWALAIEHYADYGRFANFEPLGRQHQAVFGVIDYNRDPFSLEFGISRGFTSVSEPLILKLILTHTF
jgi:MFS family permease